MALTDVKSEQIQSSVALAGSPTTTTQSASDNSTKIATTAYVETAVANLVASAPSALNTLDELAAALNDDASFSTTVTNSIATKLPLAGGTLTGALVGTTATFAGGAANNNDDANILTLNASQHARLLVDTSSTGGHRATLALESNGNELTLSTTGSASYLTSVGNLQISGGNVGIGVNPVENLHVQGATSANGDARRNVIFQDTGSAGAGLGGGISFGGYYNGTSDYVYDFGTIQGIKENATNNNYAGALRFSTRLNGYTPAERMRIDSAGNIGIGTSSPDIGSGWNKVLHLHSASAGSHMRFTDSNTGATGDSGLFVGQYHNGSYFINRENGAMLFYTNNAERIRILAGGSVGIGTNNPSATLHVDPAPNVSTSFGSPLIKVGGDNSWAGNGSIYSIGLGYVDSSVPTKSPAEIGLLTTDNSGHTKGALVFATRNVGTDTAPSERMRIDSSGKVGIATNSPTQLLHITGNDNQLTIDANGSSANSGLFFAEQGSMKWEVYHRGADDTFRIYNYATSSPNIQISAAGAVTKEKQPYVQGRGNAGWSGTGGSGAWDLQPHNSTPVVSENRGNCYSTTNKRFTCPVAGVYLVQASWYIYQTAAASVGSQYVHPAVFRNGSSGWNGGHQPYTISGQMMNQSGSGSKHYDGVQISFTIACAANDYLEIYLYSPNGNPHSYEHYHYFSYTLLS